MAKMLLQQTSLYGTCQLLAVFGKASLAHFGETLLNTTTLP
jgi:hypothetical protein